MTAQIQSCNPQQVLGFSALVAAYPYDLPVWMPDVLVRLAKYVTDPNPIKGTVRKAFGEFWRTHQDTWPMLKKKFTDDQLFSLTNLLASPSYFT
jgi:proteasome activator subunit 4